MCDVNLFLIFAPRTTTEINDVITAKTTTGLRDCVAMSPLLYSKTYGLRSLGNTRRPLIMSFYTRSRAK